MASLILRLTKGTPLTNAEVDGNFTALNNELATKITASSADTLTNKIIDDINNRVGADHIHFKVKATQNLVAGNVVKITGYNSGENAYEVAKVASASDVAVGVVHGTIAIGAFGAIVNTGLLEGFDTSAFAVGQILYPNTSGGFTATQPSSGTYQAIAFVLRSHAVNGAVLVEASEPAAVRTTANTANTVVLRDASGNFSAGTITAALSGNATTATSAAKWTTARTLSFTGDATGSGSVDGSANVATALTLANSGVTAGTYNSVTVDAKGRVTAGTNPTTLSGHGITSGLKTVNGESVFGSGNIQIDGGVTSFNTRTGAVSLGASDITAAIGGGNPVDITGVLVDTATGVMQLGANGFANPGVPAAIEMYTTGSVVLAGGAMFVSPSGMAHMGFGAIEVDANNNEVKVYSSKVVTESSFGTLLTNTSAYGNGYAPLSAEGKLLTSYLQTDQAYGVASLDGDGKLNRTQLPALWSSDITDALGYVPYYPVPGELVLTDYSIGSYAVSIPSNNSDPWADGAFLFKDGSGTSWSAGKISYDKINDGLNAGALSYANLAGLFISNPTSTLTFGVETVLHTGNLSSFAVPRPGGGSTGAIAISMNGGSAWSSTASFSYDPMTGDFKASGLAANTFVNALTFKGNSILTSANYSSYALPLSGGTLTGNIIAADNNVGGVFGNLEIGYGGRYNTLQTKTNADTLWLQYSHSGTVGIAYGGGATTVYGTLSVNGAITQGGNQVLHAGNYTSYSPSLTGTGASGTWGISVSGSAATLTTARTINGVSFNGSANITVADATKLPLAGGTFTGKLIGSGPDSFRMLESVNTSAGSPVQFFIEHNLGNVNIGNARGNINISSGALQQGGNQVLHAGNYTSYSPSLTGTGASGTWGISVSGNATTTSQRNFSGDIAATGQGRFTGWYGGGSGNSAFAAEIGVSAGEAYILAYNRGTSSYGNLNFNASNIRLDPQGGGAVTVSNNTVLHAGNYNSYSPTLTGGGASGTWGISITGNAATATALQTARTINGVSFNGTANITVADSTKLPLSGGTMSGLLNVVNAGGNSYNENIRLQRATSGYVSIAMAADATGSGSIAGQFTQLVYPTATNAGDFAIRANATDAVRITTAGAVNMPVSLSVAGNVALHAGNYNTYAPTKTGTGASGTWGIAITGNAGSASSVLTQAVTTNGSFAIPFVPSNSTMNQSLGVDGDSAFTYNPGTNTLGVSKISTGEVYGTTFYGTATSASQLNGYKVVDNSNEMTLATGFAGGTLYLNYRGASAGITDLRICNGLSTGTLTTVSAATFNGPLSGNATTATTLQTARTLTIGLTGKAVDGSANVTWSSNEIGGAVAWALVSGQLSGTSNVLIAGTGFSSVTEISTGQYTGTFSVTRSSTNYAVVFGNSDSTGGTNHPKMTAANGTSAPTLKSTSQFTFGTNYDMYQCMLAVFSA